MRKIQVACVQMRSGKGIDANIADASELIRKAAAGGAQLIVTPEMTSLLDKAPGATFAASIAEDEDRALQAFRSLAKDVGAWLVIGSLPIRVSDTRCANRQFLISPDGEVVARYDKIHMFDVQLNEGNIYRESRDYAPGDKLVVAETPLGKIGMTICYDVRFPHLHRDLAKAGAEILTGPAAFTKITGEAHWHPLLRARAIETGCFMIAAAQGGRHEDGRETFGHSLIIGPWGEILAEGGTDPGVVSAEIDLDEVSKARRKIPALEHDRPYTLTHV
ncbi:MAG: carbon-nitrogen hydrolase family protein [Hyphomonadaceae bacterium]